MGELVGYARSVELLGARIFAALPDRRPLNLFAFRPGRCPR
jgi:hypothetical protein